MPGFGHGPFGHEPFGEADWSRYTLYELIPDLYRNQDEEGHLRNFIEALYPSFDKLRRAIRQFEALREPRHVPTQFDGIGRLRLGPVVVPQGEIEQQGINGSVNALFEFSDSTARFRDGDRGKELTVRGSTLLANNRTVTIVSILSLTRVLTSPPLATDVGPLKWELREKVVQPEDYITVEVRGGDVSNVAPGWVVNDGLRDFVVRARRQFLDKGGQAFQTEKEGTDGDIDANGFASATANFTHADVGKYVSIAGSALGNDGKYEILSLDTIAFSPPRLQLRGFLSDESDLVWALLPHPQLDLEGRAVPKGVVEQEGRDLALIGGGSGDVETLTANFSSTDVGKYIRIRGSPFVSDDSQYKITAVVSTTRVTTNGSFAAVATDLFWEMRSETAVGNDDRSGRDLKVVEENVGAPGISRVVSSSVDFDPGDGPIGLNDVHQLDITNSTITGNNQTVNVQEADDDGSLLVDGGLVLDAGPLTWRLLGLNSGAEADLTRVEIHPPALILLFAPDFGITIDTQEGEDRQRSYVEHVNAWLDLKGHESAYDIIGTLSGFDTTVQQLYHIDPDFVSILPAAVVMEVGEASFNRLGNDGALTAGTGGRIRFSAGSALFRASDVGRAIRINNASTAGNNKIFTIDVFVDAQTVEFRLTDTAVVPDYGVAGTAVAPTLRWILVRFFTTTPPLLPLFDEVNSDQMTDYIATNPPVGDEFLIDKFCWEDDFAAFVDVTIVASTNIGGNYYKVEVSGPADVIPRDPAGPTRQMLPGVVWILTDSIGREFVLETVPEVAGPNYTFEVVADPTLPPTPGTGTLTYNCRPQFRCEYCGAAAIAITLELGAIATETGVAIERVLERVLLRENEEPKPAHVELILIFKQIFEARLNLQAEMDANLEIFPTLYAALTAYYDEIEGDVIITDTTLLAEVQTP